MTQRPVYAIEHTETNPARSYRLTFWPQTKPGWFWLRGGFALSVEAKQAIVNADGISAMYLGRTPEENVLVFSGEVADVAVFEKISWICMALNHRGQLRG